MSWLWSSAPPGDADADAKADAGAGAGAYAQLHRDPYAERDAAASDVFGDAFDDDAAAPVSALPPPDASFDLYAAPAATPPPLDFSGVSRIDPHILSARSAAATARGGAAAEYVFAEDYAATRKKGWGEQLTYLAGCCYLGGATVGALHGLRGALAESSGRPLRLRVNAVLNATGRRGALLANSAGVLALAFSLSESALYTYRSEDDVANYAVAGAAAGALFRSTAGARAAATSGLAAALVAVGAVYASRRGWYGRRLQGML